MKNKIILSIIFLLGVCCFTIWPVYHALMYKGLVPMLGKPDIPRPINQPQQSKIFNQSFQHLSNKAIAVLQAQSDAIAAPGYTAAVAINGEKIWGGSCGWANIEMQIPMTPQTQLRVGSTSKAITSVGLTQLVKQGLLELDAPIKNYLDDLPNAS